MATTTARLGLRKPAGSDTVNVVTDIDNAMDTLDAVVGLTDCTSTTRPSTPFKNQLIRESDTGSYYVSNGSAPASASWVPVVSTEGPVTVGYTGPTAPLRIQTTYSTPSGNRMIDGRKAGDANPTYQLDFDGKMQWGPGGASASDTDLYRVSVGALGIRGGAALGCFVGVPNQVTNPYTDMLLVNTTDHLIYRYDGTAWVVAGGQTVGGQYRTSVPAGITTAETVLVSTGSISLDRNSLYKVTFQALGNVSIATNDFDMRIRETSVTGALVKEKVIPNNTNAFPVGDVVSHLYATTVAESKAWVGTIQRINGAGTFTPTVGTFIQVQKVGSSTLMSTV